MSSTATMNHDALKVRQQCIIDVREADAEALPFADGDFDVVLSTFGTVQS
jgi:ubiquinone/menaquinone biosynthesis C-methylase UbiE